MRLSPNHFSIPLPRGEPNQPVSRMSFEQVDEDSYPTSNATLRQSSEEQGEVEARQARSHQLYSANPHLDELYHCPYESSDNCVHKPTKLKCVYEY